MAGHSFPPLEPRYRKYTPRESATGTLEWAYATLPAGVARFSFTGKPSVRSGARQLTAKVILRADGKQQRIEVTPVNISVAP